MIDTHHPKKVAKSGAIYTFALIAQKILSFLYFSLVARALGPDNLGQYIFALSFAAFFSLFVDFGFVPMAIRNFSQDKGNLKENFKIFLSIRFLLAILGVILLFLTAFLLGYSKPLLIFVVITAFIMVMDAFTAFFYTVLRSRQNLFYESIGTVIFQIIVFSLGVFVISKTQEIQHLLFVILSGSLFHFLYSAFILKNKTEVDFGFDFSKDKIAYWLRRAAPFFLAAGFIKAYNTIDTILIKNISGNEAVGLYAIPAKIVFTFPFIALAITASVYPAMSNYVVESKERLQNIFSKTLLLLLSLSLPIAVGISLLSEQIIMTIWPEFSSSAPALMILIWAVVFLYIEYPFGSVLNATKNEKQNTINRGVQLLVFVLLNLLLIPIYGYFGAIYSALFGSVLIVVLGYIKARKIIAVFTPKLNFALLKLILASVLMGALIYAIRFQFSFLIVIPVAALGYVFLLFVLKVYTKNDWLWFLKIIKKENKNIL